ncbi:MAG: hypothetical protein ISR65_14020 [Bacteriovoracaceae bacterium]|nr:hypothetical protein [Bacteriovoracaceae bacterium]
MQLLKLCTIVLRSEGYRVISGAHHYITIASIPYILGESRALDSDYLNRCREKRNIAEYEYVGGVSEDEVEEFRDDVEKWIYTNHSELIKPT